MGPRRDVPLMMPSDNRLMSQHILQEEPGGYLIQLRVTDSTGTSFPSSPGVDLSDVASAQVLLRSAQDPGLRLRGQPCLLGAKLSKIQLTWTHRAAIISNVYPRRRSGWSYVKFGGSLTHATTHLSRQLR